MSSVRTSSAPAQSARIVQPLPGGILHWFAPEHSDTLESRLYAFLLCLGQPASLDAGALAARLDAPVRDVAAALFALNRAGSIALVEATQAPVAWTAYGLGALTDDLAMMATPGQSLMLSTDDGLTIACIGWTAYEARVLAVRLRSASPGSTPTSHRLQFGRHHLYLTCSGALDTGSLALLRLAYRLSFATGQTASPSSLDTPRP